MLRITTSNSIRTEALEIPDATLYAEPAATVAVQFTTLYLEGQPRADFQPRTILAQTPFDGSITIEAI